jgi:Fur family ferric uptake transcriptional regulator/Fur family peroxide stress response transcriptional regulator
MKTQTEAIQRLQQCGIKPSLQRIAVMEYLLKNYTHPTVDTIFNKLQPAIPTLSKTTVYNTLNLLAAQGAVSEITIDDKNVRYDANTSQHAHFKCTQCGKLYDLPVNPKLIAIKQINNFMITESQYYYKGYCPKCNRS